MLEDSNVGWGGGLKALHANLATRNITQCWFAYAAPANPANFQIPCKRLPSFFSAVTDQGQQQPVPEQIDGPIFISSEELNGSFWGIGDTVPYHSLQIVEPSRVIAGEIIEFDGSFDLPKVSAISDWVYATGLLRRGKLDEAIAAAQQATQLDPSSIYARETLYTAYAVAHKFDDAEREYHAALAIYQGLNADEKKAVFAPPTDPLAKH